MHCRASIDKLVQKKLQLTQVIADYLHCMIGLSAAIELYDATQVVLPECRVSLFEIKKFNFKINFLLREQQTRASNCSADLLTSVGNQFKKLQVIW